MSDSNFNLIKLGAFALLDSTSFKDQMKSKNSADELCKKLNIIEDKIDLLSRKIDLIFGNNFLINGEFVDLKDFKKQ